jgi:hypothetical protein
MPFKQRLLIFTSFWLLAGVVLAIFAEGSVEAGESEFLDGLRFLYLAPLISAMGVAFTLVHREGSGVVDAAWQHRQFYEGVVFWSLLAAFVVHAVITLTRKTRRQFIILSVTQLVFLALSVPCVLYFYHYEATHGHG